MEILSKEFSAKAFNAEWFTETGEYRNKAVVHKDGKAYYFDFGVYYEVHNQAEYDFHKTLSLARTREELWLQTIRMSKEEYEAYLVKHCPPTPVITIAPTSDVFVYGIPAEIREYGAIGPWFWFVPEGQG